MVKENEELKKVLENPSPKNLRDFFNYRSEVNRNVYLLGEFDDYQISQGLEKLSPSQAFDLMYVAAEICLEQKDVNLLECAIFILWTLVTTSKTTEMPEEMQKLWASLMTHAGEFNSSKDVSLAWTEITKWYRRSK